MPITTVTDPDTRSVQGEAITAPGYVHPPPVYSGDDVAASKARGYPAVVVELRRTTKSGRTVRQALVMTLDEAREFRDGVTADIRRAARGEGRR